MFRCLWEGWLHIEVIRLVPHERVQQQTVEVTRPRMMKEAVNAVTLFSFERLQRRTVEQVPDLFRFQEETVEVVRLAQRERVHRTTCGSASATIYVELSMSGKPCWRWCKTSFLSHQTKNLMRNIGLPLHCDGSARPGAAHTDGAVLALARRWKERTYPELTGRNDRTSLVVFAGEIGSPVKRTPGQSQRGASHFATPRGATVALAVGISLGVCFSKGFCSGDASPRGLTSEFRGTEHLLWRDFHHSLRTNKIKLN